MKTYDTTIKSVRCEGVVIDPDDYKEIAVTLHNVDSRSLKNALSADLIECLLCDIGEDKIKAIFAKIDAEEAAEAGTA